MYSSDDIDTRYNDCSWPRGSSRTRQAERGDLDRHVYQYLISIY